MYIQTSRPWAWNLELSKLLWLDANEILFILDGLHFYYAAALANIRWRSGTKVVNRFRRQASLTVWSFFPCLVTFTLLSTKPIWLRGTFSFPRRKKVIRPSERPPKPFGSRQTLTCWIWSRAITCHYGDQEIWRMTWFWRRLCPAGAFADRSVAGAFCAPHMLEACSVKSSVC